IGLHGHPVVTLLQLDALLAEGNREAAEAVGASRRERLDLCAGLAASVLVEGHVLIARRARPVEVHAERINFLDLPLGALRNREVVRRLRVVDVEARFKVLRNDADAGIVAALIVEHAGSAIGALKRMRLAVMQANRNWLRSRSHTTDRQRENRGRGKEY